MSELLEPAAVWQGLQEVQDGADPADVYQKLMAESVDAEDVLMDEYWASLAAEHDNQECQGKFTRGSFCHGSQCRYFPGGMRLQVDCPCACHAQEAASEDRIPHM